MNPTHMVLVPTTTAAQRLTTAIAGLNAAQREANQAIARVSYTFALVRTLHQIQP